MIWLMIGYLGLILGLITLYGAVTVMRIINDIREDEGKERITIRNFIDSWGTMLFEDEEL